MNLLQSRRNRQRSYNPSSAYEILSGFSFQGSALIPIQTTMPGKKVETPPNDFCGYVEQIYKRDGVIWSVIEARSLLLSETTFKYRTLSDKRLFGDPSLALLEHPWPNGTTGELMKRMEQDTSLAGNFYAHYDGTRLWRLDPGRVGIMLTSEREPDDPLFGWDATVVGYSYAGYGGRITDIFLPDEIVHWSPVPDPSAHYRGMSWVTPVIREVTSDMAVNDHKQAFFENAATPNMVVKFPESINTPEQFNKLYESMEASHAGADNAYRTLYLAAGADASVVGATAHIDFKALQGTYETRICMAGRCPPSVAGASEGLQGSSLNAGNFSEAKQQFADSWYHPTIKDACGALSQIAVPPQGSQLWYDPTDIAFLRVDAKDSAVIRQTDAVTIRNLTDAGYTPDSAIAAVNASDWTLLVHTGLFSVQLQPPMSSAPEPPTAPTSQPVGSSNGSA